MTPEELIAEIEAAAESEDIERLKALGGNFTDGGQSSLPFQPDIQIKGFETRGEDEAEIAIGMANGWSRMLRRLEFKSKIRKGYAGPVIVSEGDSWFQYPVILHDVIDNLAERFAVLSLGAAGDTLANMRAHREYRNAISENRADIFLFSASGNDVLGGGDLAKLLNSFSPGMELGDVLKAQEVAKVLDFVEENYEAIIRDAISVRPGLRVMFHGYDRPVPRRNGKWLGKPMESLGIPPTLQSSITGHLIDRLNERLSRLETRFPGQVTHVDCRGRVGGSVGSWYDELHPRNPGYSRVASLFEAQIDAAEEIARPVSVPTMPGATDEVWTPLDIELAALEQEEEAIIDSDPALPGGRLGTHLSPLDKEILEDFRSLQRAENQPDDQKRLRARRHMVPADDEKAFERILGDSNLFPVNYLSRGAIKARSVAKIQLFFRGEIPAGSGSGFLVAPGLMLTNNHVISSRDAARRAKAVFDYQDDDLFQPKATQIFDITDDLFFTSDRTALDFTFVSVKMDNASGASLEQFSPFTLVEESGKAIKGEPVSIVQHPRGDRKMIALRDSTIIGVKDNFIYYSTDTEPGSSGAPVLNDQWLPVALHHRSVPHETIPGKWIANRGIRISRIFNTLRSAAEAGDSNARTILALLGADPQPRADQMVQPGTVLRNRETDFMPTVSDTVAPGVDVHSDEVFDPSRWDGVQGYDPDFLDVSVPLPVPAGGAGILEVNNRPDLPYHHFSVVMHADRKLAMFTACNTDGSRLRRLSRSGRWQTDPRLPVDAQTGNDAYRNNDYDRGHLVRRVAPMWGTDAEARLAQADTFHYTVCAPQHARLNQRVWLELEDYLLDWAEDNAARLSIFTGPIFRADDPEYRDIVRVPADYWKVAVAQRPSGPRAVGYLHTQKNLIPTVEEAFGDYKTHRVPIHVLADLTGLNFSVLEPFDVADAGFEIAGSKGDGSVRLVNGKEDIGF